MYIIIQKINLIYRNPLMVTGIFHAPQRLEEA